MTGTSMPLNFHRGPCRRRWIMKVLLVRHAQSANNIVQARVHTKITAGVSSEIQAQHEWL